MAEKGFHGGHHPMPAAPAHYNENTSYRVPFALATNHHYGAIDALRRVGIYIPRYAKAPNVFELAVPASTLHEFDMAFADG